MQPQEFLPIVHAAGEKILAHYGKPIPVEKKADDSPLTLADQDAHHSICDALAQLTPGIPVLSEESDTSVHETRRGWDRFWLVDPLDGTKDFIKQTGCFTVNIALIDHGRPVLGIIHVPAKNLCYWAAEGEGAYRQDGKAPAERIRVASPDLSAPRIVASRDHAGPAVAELLSRFPGNTCLSIGSSLKFCLVAEGKADVYLRDVPTFEWDVGAAQIIVTEAGGTVYDLRNGKPLRYNKDDLRNGALLTVGQSGISDWL